MGATRDLPADRRFFTGASWACAPRPGFFGAWRKLIHGNQAAFLVELALRAPAPRGIENERIDLVHANHYFTLPFVSKLLGERRAPVILETQDVQARQYVLRNQGGFFLKPLATYDEMLAIELDWMTRADLCVHLNEEERQAFAHMLPGSRHALLYPAVAPVAASSGGDKIIIVASDNYANYLSLRWFLREVCPLAPDVPVEIFGNVDGGVRGRDRALFEANRELFMGRVDDIATVYATAACVLLPTIEGHGLSIKTVEALSSGAPLIAMPPAFRGMRIDPRDLRNVILVEDAQSFAAAMRAISLPRGEAPARATSDTRRIYDEVFSFDAYVRALGALAAPLLEPSRADS